ncbi:Cell division cycle protein cdt2 [Psilocybe cubensis]|uniref:Cell division cycle protein cdt2 n=3 Tax=Psilocybe cubensis TaxID=181762 RepID=A0ACB8GI80_PSICU|nr:Cell division cycle protein cdt2 [Psilocybe cubensis]XP_047744587.1 Cell division cycle protein cdt2 [Psilocybe cubensis]XP_047747500.1 Cell division cycle protein cdt2 [Psilocybe cubensis]KAH9475314.1 Cell division cycle protein cdt2 [Psilocybe cubensis]KAH9476962.1 Cell division cycle protein cdt2 [Psilocybe cubensis]KAH9479875.1 Cell division cycle protein cdt2 [Psilocybe cubensis]
MWHPMSESLVYTGGRDGAISLWDLRMNPSVRLSSGSTGLRSVATIVHAHQVVGSSPEPTITGLVLQDTATYNVISSCSANGFLRLWDLRSTNTYLSCSSLDPTVYNHRQSRGIVSLVSGVKESDGTIFGLGTDARIYVYCVLDLNVYSSQNPCDSLWGSPSFYVKSSLSPCGRWLAYGGGPHNGDAFIFSVARDTRLDVGPIHAVRLRGGSSSSCGVDWSSDSLAVCAEAGRVRIWRSDPGKRRECEIQPDINKNKWSWATTISQKHGYYNRI